MSCIAELHFALLLPFTGLWSLGSRVAGAAALAVQRVRTDQNLLPGYVLEYSWADSGCSAKQGLTAIGELLAGESRIDAYIVMTYAAMPYTLMEYTVVMEYTVTARAVTAYRGTAYTVMAHRFMASTTMACIVTAHAAMVYIDGLHSDNESGGRRPSRMEMLPRHFSFLAVIFVDSGHTVLSPALSCRPSARWICAACRLARTSGDGRRLMPS